MPVDTTGKDRRVPSFPRRPPQHASMADDKQRDQEKKRLRGDLACAECSRLKLKCDKNVPCSSCVRRGCSPICPNSCLSAGHGTRYVLAETGQLHRKLLEMSERIRQLEDALAIETANSPECHPLLLPELLAIKHGIEETTDVIESVKVEQDGVLDDFSTLSISEQGVTHFLGRTGGEEGQLMAEFTEHEAPEAPNTVVTQVSECPFSVIRSEQREIYRTIARLPPQERAWSLCETYLQQAAWNTRIVQRTQLIDELLIPTYKALDAVRLYLAGSLMSGELPEIAAPDLALLLMVFAIASLMDMTLKSYNHEADAFFSSASSHLDLNLAAERPSLAVVQTLGFMAIYYTLADIPDSSYERRWEDRTFSFLNLSAILGLTIGLHRDPVKWKFDDKLTQRRRDVYWQIFVMQTWQCVASGRPISGNPDFADCLFPEDRELALDKDGKPEMGCWRWMYKFTRDLTYQSENLSYLLICKSRSEGSNWETEGPFKVMRRLVPALWRDSTMLFIHRGCFSKALADHPNNPLMSQYSSSFLCTYRSALALIQVIREHYELCPDFVIRASTIWRIFFSALVIMGTIVIRGPGSTLAPSALVELTLGVSLFGKVAEHAKWTGRFLNGLTRLQNKAFRTYARYLRSFPKAASENGWFEKLAISAGQAHLVPSESLSWSTTDSGQRLKSDSSTTSASMVISTLPTSARHIAAGNFDADPLLASSSNSVYPGCVNSQPTSHDCVHLTMPYTSAADDFQPQWDHDPTNVNTHTWSTGPASHQAPESDFLVQYAHSSYSQINTAPATAGLTGDLAVDMDSTVLVPTGAGMVEAWSSLLQESLVYVNPPSYHN